MHIVEPDHVNIIYDSDDEDVPLLTNGGKKKVSRF
jgi:hypothetical protein